MKTKINIPRSTFAEKVLYLNGAPLSLDDYKFMRNVYDSEHPSVVLHTSRQISKCGLSSTELRLYNGKKKRLDTLEPGDELLAFDEERQKVIINKVKLAEDNGTQDTYLIKTRTGRELEITGEHPI